MRKKKNGFGSSRGDDGLTTFARVIGSNREKPHKSKTVEEKWRKKDENPQVSCMMGSRGEVGEHDEIRNCLNENLP